jgi:hypothetical protein
MDRRGFISRRQQSTLPGYKKYVETIPSGFIKGPLCSTGRIDLITTS